MKADKPKQKKKSPNSIYEQDRPTLMCVFWKELANVKNKETIFDISELVSFKPIVTLTIKFVMNESLLKFLNVTKV